MPRTKTVRMPRHETGIPGIFSNLHIGPLVAHSHIMNMAR